MDFFLSYHANKDTHTLTSMLYNYFMLIMVLEVFDCYNLKWKYEISLASDPTYISFYPES